MVSAVRQLSLTAVIFVLGLLTAHSPAYPTTLRQTEDKKTPEVFLSGGASSEKVLVEILATLEQIDTRINNIEDLLQKTAETPTEKPARHRPGYHFQIELRCRWQSGQLSGHFDVTRNPQGTESQAIRSARTTSRFGSNSSVCRAPE